MQEQMIQLYIDRDAMSVVAKKLDISRACVHKYLHLNNVTVRTVQMANIGKIRSNASKERYSACQTGNKNPMFGTKLSKEHVKKMHDAMIGKPNGMFGKKQTLEAKEKISFAMTGEKHPLFGKVGYLKGVTGKNHPRYGKPCNNVKGGFYKGIYFRSSWEILFAMWLDLKGYTWQYEPKRFYFEDITYCPDFWVDEFNSYVEIKGFFRKPQDYKKISLFIKQNPLILIENVVKYETEVGITTNQIIRTRRQQK